MSGKPLRRTIPVNRRIKPHNPSPPTHRFHRKVAVRRSSNKHSKVIKRCNSEPTLLTAGISITGTGVADEHRDMTPPGESSLLFRNRIVTDVFSSSPELLPNSPQKVEVYNRDAKVAVKVTVEGSVGPIIVLVKLGSSVDETIKLVMNKYNTEGRNPRLDQDAITSFQLHHSFFSLQCLDKSNMIGDFGRRSFYMRKGVDMFSNTSNDSEIVVATKDDSPSTSLNAFFLHFIYQEFKKMITRTTRICRFSGCFGG